MIYSVWLEKCRLFSFRLVLVKGVVCVFLGLNISSVMLISVMCMVMEMISSISGEVEVMGWKVMWYISGFIGISSSKVMVICVSMGKVVKLRFRVSFVMIMV